MDDYSWLSVQPVDNMFEKHDYGVPVFAAGNGARWAGPNAAFNNDRSSGRQLCFRCVEGGNMCSDHSASSELMSSNNIVCYDRNGNSSASLQVQSADDGDGDDDGQQVDSEGGGGLLELGPLQILEDASGHGDHDDDANSWSAYFRSIEMDNGDGDDDEDSGDDDVIAGRGGGDRPASNVPVAANNGYEGPEMLPVEVPPPDPSLNETAPSRWMLKKKLNKLGSYDRRHKYQHFREKEFVCDFCEHNFTLKQGVQCHIEKYHLTGENPFTGMRGKKQHFHYKCSECGKVLMSSYTAERHRQVHVTRARRAAEKAKLLASKCVNKPLKRLKIMLYKCCGCDRFYPSKRRLASHILQNHRGNFTRYDCDQCDASYTRKGSLHRHKLFSHLGRTYSCPIESCGHDSFKCSKAVKAHVLSNHTNERPFGCDLCSKAFFRRSDMLAHRKNVHHTTVPWLGEDHSPTLDEKSPVSCTGCRQSFLTGQDLRRHAKTCLRAMLLQPRKLFC